MAITSDRLRELAPRQVQGEGLSAGGFLLLAVATISIGAALGIAGYHWMQPPDVSQAVIAATTGPRGAFDTAAAFDDGSWTDADLRRCGAEATAAAETASKRKLAAVSADRVGLGGPDPAMVERTTYLLCSATSKPLHFCNAYWRGSFIEAIKTHAADFRTIASSAYWTKVVIAERARRASADQGALQSINDDLDQTTREMGKMHEDIAAAFRSLVSDGIISRDEFGVFLGFGIPPDIRAMLGDTRAVRNLCG